MRVEFIAKCAHEINKTYCESIGDHSQLSWGDAPQWQRESAITLVQYLISDPYALPEDTHISWLAHKMKDGWVYGPTKDPEKKEHPCMVPYDRLPEQQRAKDHLFHTVVRLLK